MRILCVLILGLGLSGCGAGDGLKLGAFSLSERGSSGNATSVQKRYKALQGQVTVVGPKGYCVASAGVHEADGGAFVPLAPCVSMGDQAPKQPPKSPFFLAASVQPLEDQMSINEGEFVPAARSALDAGALRDALGPDARILSYRGEGQALIAKTRAEHPTTGLDPQQWRAIFMHESNLISLSVSGFSGVERSEKQSEEMLLAFLKAMQAANPAAQSGSGTTTAELGVSKFFRRLLN